MRKTLKIREKRARAGGRILAATTLAISLAAFGCSTTDNNSTVSGQPATSTPAAGSMGTNPASTPGSSSGTAGIPPHGMVSAAEPDTDAIATMKADEAYGGRVLGPASPGASTQSSSSTQQDLAQASWPSLTANPISTVNSSISSPATPAIVSGAAGDGAALTVVAPSGGVTSSSVSGATNSGATVGVANTGVTGVSNTTASPITNGAATVTTTTTGAVQGNGMVMSVTPAAGSAIATPTLGTTARLNVDNGIGVTGGVGNASVVSGVNGGNATANGVVLSGSNTASTTNASNPVTAGLSSGTATSGASGNVVLGTTNTTGSTSASSATTARALTVGTAKTATSASAGAKGNMVISRSPSTGTATAPIAVVTDASGAVTVTNVKPQSQSVLRRAATALHLTGRTRAVRPSATPNTATPQPVNSTSGTTQQQ